MLFPLFRKKTVPERIMFFLRRQADKVRVALRKLPKREYVRFLVLQKLTKVKRRSVYFAEDSWFIVKKLKAHTEVLLFSVIIFFGIVMLISSAGASIMNSVIALFIMVLAVIIYMQLKFQSRLLEQYVPRLDFLRISRCALFSDRVRIVNIYGAPERLDSIKTVRNVKIRYEVVNDSFAPISIEGVSLVVRLKKGPKISMPPTTSVLDVEPKKSAFNEATFRLPRAVRFDNVQFVELWLMGNVRKKVRIRPHLYVNLLLRGRVPEEIFEPFDKFRKRKGVAGSRKPL
jgi:hypothetical protein